jgi:rhamnogalacturonan endolyase
MHRILWISTLGLILYIWTYLAGAGDMVLLYHTDFSNLTPGKFGELSKPVFPEYHHVPRKFTDGWQIVNNRGPEEWKVFEIEDKQVLSFLGYNSVEWTKDFIYPMLATGDPLWRDYSLEVQATPLTRADAADLRGVLFRYQDGRHYYFFGFGPNQTLVLQYRDGEKGFRLDGWHELGRKAISIQPDHEYCLYTEVKGTRIVCRFDGQLVFDLEDRRYAEGKIGLLACSPVRFHEVTVKTSREEATALAARQTQQQVELHNLQNSNPHPRLWKKITTPGFGTARATRLGDLDGDGRPELLLIQNIPFFNANYHQISCMTALDLGGKVLWQVGKPDPANTTLSYDVAVQIHDIDGDGLPEVIYAHDRKIRILEGKTGKLKTEFAVPVSVIQEDETSWKEYQHYYRRDHLPFLNVDCIAFADLRGTGRPADILIKDRHTRLWAFSDKFELLWTASANLGHFPYIYDVDGDHRDEVLIGYTLFDHDGKVLWTLDKQLEEHADGICAGPFCNDLTAGKVFIAASDDGVVVAGLDGKILRHHRVGHAQTPSIGQFRPDIPGLEFCTINYWGEPGMISLYNGCSGEEINHFELIHEGSPILPVNWRGDGLEFILLSTDPEEGGMVDGWGRRAVLFPHDGHPDIACLALDLTGDARDEIITWDPEAIWIYTQAEEFNGKEIYSPRRPKIYNESNYAPQVSLPQWVPFRGK